MPVQVHVPVTVRLPQNGWLAPADLADLEVGAGDALARALDTIREEVLEPRGHERFVAVGDASLRFAPDVAEAQQADLALAIQRAVDHAVARSALRSWYRPSGPPAALTGPPVEWMDPAQRGDGTYSIQMFDDGTPADVTYTFEEDPGDVITAGPFTSQLAAAIAWEAHLERFGRVWDPAAYGYPGYYGNFVHHGKQLEKALVYTYHVDSVGEDGWPINPQWQIGGFDMLAWAESSDRIVRQALRPSMGHWLLTKTDEPTNYDNILRLYTERNAARPEAEKLPDEVIQRIARIAADFAVANPGCALWSVADGETTNYIVLENAGQGNGAWGVGHSPVRFIAQQQLPGTEDAAEGAGGEREGGGRGDEAGEGGGGREGEGGDGGTGRGRGGGGRRGLRGGPLGKAEGHGSLWPTLGLGGEPLVCEPFLGEPPVDQLVEGGEALASEMRDLCSMLELDYCGYAGKLCLNLARLLGARAHAIGVTSITSTITTAVTSRPDGSGNNGFVDIRPGTAPELQYMEVLADLAVRVNNLANNISRTYLASANQHLIYWDEDREYDPDAAAWSLRFWIQMADILPDGCMWLYAETCRVILLQQLRSSHAGIVARQDQFEEIHRQFAEALGILGESVVKLSVLKQAIAYADRYSLTGSVRSVLSHRPPVRYIGREREPYQPPAPAESMSPQIFEVLEGATIERQGDQLVARYDNRTWTTQDLEQGVGMRRGILNMADPLFNQVPNLDQLYHQFRRNPSSTETFLRDLLRDMREANEEMTRETSSWEEGAFFALEASQWVAAEGGVNAQGLHYNLQGIHKLADDVLRPWIGSLAAYAEGVDKAIGIKANWDRFLQVFAVVGVIALALLCAPLGAVAVGVVTGAVGIALTLRDVAEAERLEDLYRSLEDPEAILAWQDVQLARLMADLSIAFSIFDVVGVGKGARAIVSGARTALREAAEQGVRTTVRASLQSARRTILANMAEEVLRNAVRQAAVQAAIAVTMQAVLPVVITPVLVPWIRGIALEHGSLNRVDTALGGLTAGQPATPVAVRAELPTDIELPADDPALAVEAEEETADGGTFDVTIPEPEPGP